MEIKCNFRTFAGREAHADQFTSKFHNYFYTNRNEVIQEPKLLLRKSSFNEKYQKNTNTDGLNPENQNSGHVQITKNCWSNLQTPTLKNHHFILVTYFNVIPIG